MGLSGRVTECQDTLSIELAARGLNCGQPDATDEDHVSFRLLRRLSVKRIFLAPLTADWGRSDQCSKPGKCRKRDPGMLTVIRWRPNQIRKWRRRWTSGE